MNSSRDPFAVSADSSVGSPRAITKILVPGKRARLLHRSRLIDFLHAHIERKLLLVSASAGYGKTSLVVDFAADTTLPVCWYSLDPSDGDPKTFLEYLVASLQRQFPEFGARTRGLLADAGTLRDLDVIVGTLITEIQETIPGYFVLVLDDYHTVEESASINQILDTLLRLLPEHAHIILASRTLPSRLTLTRLAARQEIAGLGVNELRFTADEIRALIQQNYQAQLSEQQAAELAEQSEGWITGILLTTHSLWQGLFKDLVRVRGPHSHVFNYLASEVFAQQPHDVQQFLLDSSIFDQLSPTLCDELLQSHNAEEMLRSLEQRNLFIVRLDEGDEGTTIDDPRTGRATNDQRVIRDVPAWYRYHHLFQEFLQSRLRMNDPTRWQALNRRAAALFESRGAWDQVIIHYQRAEAYDDAARVIEQIAKETLDAGRWTTLAKWIDNIPQEILGQHPNLIVARANVLRESGDLTRALELLTRAIAIFDESGNRESAGKALIRQSICWHFQGQYQQAIETCRRALELVGSDSKGDIAEAHRTIGISQGRLGNWTECIQELEIAADLYESIGDAVSLAYIRQDLGVAYRTVGKIGAEKYFQQALDYWRHAGNRSGLAATLNSVGVGYHRQGDYTQAIETLGQAYAEAHACGQLRIEAFALASLGDVYRDQGEHLRAQESYRQAFEIAQKINEGFVITFALAALGGTFRLAGDAETAERLIRQSLEQAQNHHSDYELGLTETELGILLDTQGDPKTAEIHLTRAIELLEQGGAKRDSARAHLYLGKTYFHQRKYGLVRAQMQAVVDTAEQLREHQFIVAEGAAVVPVLQYAISKRIGGSPFAQAIQKIQSGPSLPIVEQRAEYLPIKRPRLEVYALGSSSVLVDERLVTKTDWDSVAAKELFLFLLAHPQGLRKEQILSALWGDTPPAKANGIFHSTAWRMRRALFPDCLIYENGLYHICSDVELQYDVAEFERLIEQAGKENDQTSADYWRRAVTLYQGDYFEDSYSDWCVPIRTDLQQKYLAALLALARADEQSQKIAEAIVSYRKILGKDNYREDVYRDVMRLQLQAGDRAGALNTYRDCLHALQEEAQLELHSETQAIVNRILASP